MRKVSIIFFLLIGNIALAESWVQVDQAHYYDKDTLVKDGNFVSIWVKNTDNRNISGEKSTLWAWTLESYSIDCKYRTELRNAFYFVRSNGDKDRGTPLEPDKLEQIVPGSTVDRVRNAVCKSWYEIG